MIELTDEQIEKVVKTMQVCITFKSQTPFSASANAMTEFIKALSTEQLNQLAEERGMFCGDVDKIKQLEQERDEAMLYCEDYDKLSKDFVDVCLERDELLAHCELYRTRIARLIYRLQERFEWALGTIREDLQDEYVRSIEFLNTTPQQSLAEVKAQAIEEAINAISKNTKLGVAPILLFKKYTRKLREQATEK